jgi:hypothetical protein
MSKTHTYLITKKTKKMFIMFKTQLGKNWIFIFEKFLTIKNAALCLSFFFFLKEESFKIVLEK